jgi:diguanylate cyclase (GGDEF)-like protein
VAQTAADPQDAYRRLAQALKSVVNEQSTPAVLARIVMDLRALVSCDDVVIWELSQDHLRPVVIDGEDEEQMSTLHVAVGQGITGYAVLHQEIVVSQNAHLDPRAGHVPGTDQQPEAIICVPLTARGSRLGALSLYRRGTRRGFTPREQELVEQFADVAAIALDNARNVTELQQLANTDDLTGLANRRRFYQELSRANADALRHHTALALVLLDLDNFKAINDQHGHCEGDSILRAVGAAIQTRIRGGDLAARVGGDEFAILLPHTTQEEAATLAADLNDALRSIPISPQLDASSGIASGPVEDVQDLIGQADRRLYNNKHSRQRAHATTAWRGVPEVHATAASVVAGAG